ncbi:TPA: hypothetical protein ACH3X1_003220 [Trebouxia sp. C0004]
MSLLALYIVVVKSTWTGPAPVNRPAPINRPAPSNSPALVSSPVPANSLVPGSGPPVLPQLMALPWPLVLACTSLHFHLAAPAMPESQRDQQVKMLRILT